MLYKVRVLKRFCALSFAVLLLFCCCIVLSACGDDESEIEYLFDREVSELSVLRECSSKADSGAYCYQIRLHYPIQLENFSQIYLWVDSTVVGDTARSVDDKKLDAATATFPYKKGQIYDTIDLTSYIREFTKERDSLMIAVYCGYSDNENPGSIQRVYLHFGDDIAPSLVSVYDSVWTTGAMLEWSRPTDQTDYYAPNELSGPIAGYNIVIYTLNDGEDIRDLKIKVETAEGVDSLGKTLYRRHARFRNDHDSVFVDTLAHGEKTKSYLRIAIPDGKGFDSENYDNNKFRLTVEGLRSSQNGKSSYTFGISSWDSCGNSSGSEGTSSVTTNMLFSTTDSIAPLMPTSVYTIEDSLFPGMARLDSNNRLRIFWSRSVDPIVLDHGIRSDSVLIFDEVCLSALCYRDVESYKIEYYDGALGSWVDYGYAGGSGRYKKLYQQSGDTMAVIAEAKANGKSVFVVDTIRWVAPGDTLILRIRSIDSSGYYSAALIDTIAVSPGALAKEVECPSGFIAVKSSDTSVFCMERYEHRNDSGSFMVNVLQAEAMDACGSMFASGFTVSLCKERDWELVCLSGGSLAYGVIEEESSSASEYLFANCNVGTNDSASAASIKTRSARCMNPMGVFDMPGQYQEWVIGRSEDTVAVVKGGSYKTFGGLDRESQALCTNRSFPYFTRPAYTTDTVYLYREGTKVDTVFEADTTRTPYEGKPFLTKKDFKDSLQFFDVQDSNGNSIGVDYALYSEYKRGGDEWLDTLGNGLKYVPSRVEVVFLTGERVPYRKASAIYKSPAIGFRCCAYPQ